MNKKKTSEGKLLATAAGAVALGAGAYYLFGSNGKTNQKKAKVLVAKMQKEVKTELKKAKAVSAPIYNKAVEVISENYAKQYNLHAKDIKALTGVLKKEWKNISTKMKTASVSNAKPKVKKTRITKKK